MQNMHMMKSVKTSGSELRIEDLRSFIEVALSQRLADTAARMGLAQPTLSRRVSRVEKHVGTALFERAGKSLKLNARGETFLKYAQRIVAQVDEAIVQVTRLMDPERGKIRLDFMHSLGTWMVPELIRTYRSHHPHVEFELHQGAARYLVDRVLNDASDLALVGPKPVEVGSTLSWAPLLRQRLAMALPDGHRLSHHKEVRISAVKNEPFIAMAPGYGTRILLDRLTAKAGFQPQVVFESMELTTVAGLVSAGLGVAIVPVDDPYLATIGAQVRPLTPPAYRELGLIWRRDVDLVPAANSFREFVAQSRFATKK